MCKCFCLIALDTALTQALLPLLSVYLDSNARTLRFWLRCQEPSNFRGLLAAERRLLVITMALHAEWFTGDVMQVMVLGVRILAPPFRWAAQAIDSDLIVVDAPKANMP